MSEKYSLLPDNRSPLERGLELAFSELLLDIPNLYPDLLNPVVTPASLLPYLAQERGVIEWTANAPVSEQRLTVENAWPVRRMAGTKKGIELALDSIEYDAEITPWFEMTPKGEPYHFEVLAWKRNNSPVDGTVTDRMMTLIDSAKSERDTYELSMAFALQSSFRVSAVLDPGVVVLDRNYSSQILSSPVVAGGIGLTGVASMIHFYTDSGVAALPDSTACAASLSVAGHLSSYLLTDFP